MSEFLGVQYVGLPFGAAPGTTNGTNVDQIIEGVRSLAASQAGIVPLGSFASRYNEGNGGQTYYHDSVTGETVNSEGVPEIGIDDAEPVIAEASRICEGEGKVLFVSATSLIRENATEVLPMLLERIVAAGGPVLRAEVNFSCPNIVVEGGGRKPLVALDPEAMLETRSAIVKRLGADFRYSEKLTPYLGENRALVPVITGLYDPSKRVGRPAVCGFNTDPNHTLEREGKPVLRIIANVDGREVITHAGGLSGPAMRDEIYELQQEFVSLLPEDVPFIAANGVYDGQEVLRRTSGDNAAIAALGVTRFREGLRVGRSLGSTATLMAQEYYEALEAL